MNAKSSTQRKAPDTNPYEWWENALKGIRGPIYDGEPQTGYYRNKRLESPKGETPKRYRWEAVAYWKDTRTGEQRCHIEGKDISGHRMYETWPFASKYPISEETYSAYLASGQWPEHNNALAEQDRLSNDAPDDDSLEGVRARIDALVAEANRFMKKGAAKTKAEADAAADVAVRLGELYTLADKLRKEEKQPHLDAEREVDARWNPVRDAANIYRQLKAKVVQPWIDAENARLMREVQAAAAEQERLRREAEEKAAAEQEKIDEQYARDAQDAAAENRPAPPPPEPAHVELPEAVYTPPPTFTPVSAGTHKKVSSRIERTAQIEDYAKALAFFSEHDEIKALVQSLANKMAKAKMPVPGCKILENGKAV